MAAATAALAVGVGFLPMLGASAGLGPLATGAAVSVLAAAAALWGSRNRPTHPTCGNWHVTGRA